MMRRFTVQNSSGENVGEGIEWSDGRVSLLPRGLLRVPPPPIMLFRNIAALDAELNAGETTRFLDQSAGSGKLPSVQIEERAGELCMIAPYNQTALGGIPAMLKAICELLDERLGPS